VRAISDIRAVRSETNVPAAARIALSVSGATPGAKARLDAHRPLVETLARLSGIGFAAAPPPGAVQIVLEDATLALPLADVIDLGKERALLAKEIDRLAGEIGKLDARLGNEGFLAKADPEVVEEQRERRAEMAGVKAKLAEALKRLAAA
jgi:valyl-tRNA synthetase